MDLACQQHKFEVFLPQINKRNSVSPFTPLTQRKSNKKYLAMSMDTSLIEQDYLDNEREGIFDYIYFRFKNCEEKNFVYGRK